MTPPVTVACVLRSGGHYTPTWVQRLALSVQMHMTRPYEFVCLSDVDVPGVRTIPLAHPDWPGRGWWSKLELFRPGALDGRQVVYLDLDTVAIGCLDGLPTRSAFRTIRDFTGNGINSSFMAWNDSRRLFPLFEQFASRAAEFSRIWDKERPGGQIGDQGFILRALDGLGIEPQMAPEGTIASYKWHMRRGKMPGNAAAVTFHGRPKPDELEGEAWIKENWPRPAGL